MQQVSGNWEEWKTQLGEAVQLGERMNLSPEQMAARAEQIGDFLAQRIDPKNPEQKTLKELWEAADEQEQKTLAGIIIKMVSGARTH